ncbi:alpha/beta fold hydrolase [Chitinibacter sp. SCUT-21]|uniref:alpha/beta hydrolase family protein n=1 Tax=Chitinibacter sp. SCUT-21 TaxID=2970891 RepID=UPI0035A6F3DA
MYQAAWSQRLWQDPSRRNWAGDAARPLACEIWYPTHDTNEEIYGFGGADAASASFVGSKVVKDGAIVEGRWPCVLLSHGFGGSALQLGWLGSMLARQGYIAIAVNHHGNCATEAYTLEGCLFWWQRPLDLSRVLDFALQEFAIDAARIDAIGFSIGAYSALALLGAKFDLALFDQFCRSPLAKQFSVPEFPDLIARRKAWRHDPNWAQQFELAERDFSDVRIRSAVLFAPAMVPFLQPSSVRAIEKPVQIFCGTADLITPASIGAQLLHAQLPNSELHLLRDAGHYVWLELASELGRKTLPVFTVDHSNINRAAIHAHCGERVILHLQDLTLQAKREQARIHHLPPSKRHLWQSQVLHHIASTGLVYQLLSQGLRLSALFNRA